MKNNIDIKKEIIPIIILVLCVISSFYFYNKFPDVVATHWGFNGQIDGYSSKFVGALLIPMVIIFSYIMLLFLPNIDPKKDRYEDFEKVYRGFRTVFVIVMFIIYLTSCLYNIGYNIHINIVIPILVGLMMLFIGNYMGKIKNNYFFGIKTPWTLSSENVWNKTHRFGGYMFIIFGILIMISPFLNEKLGIITFLFGIVLVTVGTFLYSYIMYKQENTKKKE